MCVMQDDEFLKELDNITSSLGFNPDGEMWVYHYTSANALKSILESQKIRFTRWDFLNDKSEMLDIHEIVKQTLGEYDFDQEFKDFILYANDQIEKMELEKYLVSSDNTYIFSLSLNVDCLPMWTYYASGVSNDGYNICFNAKELISSLSENPNSKLQFIKIIYDNNTKCSIMKRVLDGLQNLFSVKPTNKDIVFQLFEFSVRLISKYFKNNAFSYENEYRILVNSPTDDEHVIVKNGLFVPYIERVFSKKSMEGIFISPTLKNRKPHIGLYSLLKTNGYQCTAFNSGIPFENI